MSEQTWRTGRKVFRTLYRQRADTPDDRDELIGVMDTPELAALASAAPDMYRALKAVEWGPEGRRSRCSECEESDQEGHLPGCKVAAALRKAEGL